MPNLSSVLADPVPEPARRQLYLSVKGVKLPPTNELIRMHWTAYSKVVRALAVEIDLELKQQGIRTGTAGWAPFSAVRIDVILQHPGHYDVDGKYGCVKPILDVLKQMHDKNNPFGLGVLRDDTDGEHGAGGLIESLVVRQIKGSHRFGITLEEA
jgi:hypothetical protein